jgi:dipeptidyl aminopeptidase/acylaminoacyl peptidase
MRVRCGSIAAVLALGLIPLAVPASAAASSRDVRSDQQIAFGRFDPDIGGFALWTTSADGASERRITAGQAYFPAWSPDRSHLLFDFPDDQGDEQIARINRDGSGFKQLTDLPGGSEVADYSPNGRRIVFDRWDPEQATFYTSLWVMRADGSRAHPLFGSGSTTFDVEPEYSPDGSRIVFGRIDPATDPQEEALFVVRADGSQPHQITPYEVGAEHPRWSPDGRSIIYDIEAGVPADGLYLVGPDGRAAHRIFQSRTLVGFKPDFSRNGRRILFGCAVVAQQQEDLCVMRADGTGVHRIIRTREAFENFPVWS